MATLLLVKEMFGQHQKSIDLRIGHPIPYNSYSSLPLELGAAAKLLRKHLYRVAAGQTHFAAGGNGDRAPGQSQRFWRRRSNACELLGETPDGKRIHLFSGGLDSPILREVGRLRELSVCAVGEGSGTRCDLDRFDAHYDHLILWDPEDLEIAGAYRMARTAKVLAEQGVQGLYTHSLFEFTPGMQPFLQQGWSWAPLLCSRVTGQTVAGLFCGLVLVPMCAGPRMPLPVGPVSISRDMPPAARDLLIYHYRSHYGAACLAHARRPYVPVEGWDVRARFTGEDAAADFVRLKHLLAHMGSAVPTLFKQYAEVAEPEGVRFLDFGVAPTLRTGVDGLVLVDVSKLKAHKAGALAWAKPRV